MTRPVDWSPADKTARLAVMVLAAVAVASPAPAQFWNPFRSKTTAAEQPKPAAKAAAKAPASLDLTEQSGPWLIVASTFSGEGAKDQATDLCLELRKDLGLPAYVHEQTFDLRGEAPVGRGIDERGRPIRMRYNRGDERTEWAVLVGDYPSVDDTLAQRDLERVRHASPDALALDDQRQTRQNFSNTRKMMAYLAGREDSAGPMRMAFLTRNPLLPEEYFKPKGVDPFVAKMNKGFDHSALEIKGKYTVKVATFTGRGTLVGASTAKRSKGAAAKNDDPLAEAAENAHLLCEAMRDKGWEAYEFHDRDESWVSVGSFEEVVSAGQPHAEVLKVLQTFGAAFNTPAAPLAEPKDRHLSADPEKQRVLQRVGQLGGADAVQLAGGMNPKYANVEVEKGKPWRPIPFDIHPEVVEAPKTSVTSALAWRN